jgi:hypothetical protein
MHLIYIVSKEAKWKQSKRIQVFISATPASLWTCIAEKWLQLVCGRIVYM